jgi:L-amino acid N-acyltransferase YncA
MRIDPMQPEDWPLVKTIYEEGIATGQATFETEAPEYESWDAAHLHDCRLVAKMDETVVGWAALSPVSSRCVYGGVAEVSVYIAASAREQGVGRTLLTALINASEQAGWWTLQSTTFRENIASIGLHKACGFREVGIRERIGQHHGVWRDTVLMERRSAVIGID